MQINVYRIGNDSSNHGIDWDSYLGSNYCVIPITDYLAAPFAVGTYQDLLVSLNNDIKDESLWLGQSVPDCYDQSEYGFITSIDVDTAEEFLEILIPMTTPGYLEKAYPELFI